MTPQQLAKLVETLEMVAPISAKFEADLVRLNMSDIERRWYTTQKEHWLGWLGGYDGPGYYGRKDWKGRDGKFVFNHIMNPAMLLWLCEASGTDSKTVEEARIKALEAKRVYASQCSAIRKVVSWEMVEASLRRKPARQRAIA